MAEYMYTKNKIRWEGTIVPGGCVYGRTDDGMLFFSDGILVHNHIVRACIRTPTSYGDRWFQNDLSAKDGTGKEILRVKQRATNKETRKAPPQKQATKQHKLPLLHFSQPETYTPPRSTILVVTVCRRDNGARGDIIVVSDPRDQDSKRGFYWAGRVVPSIIMFAIRTSRKHKFSYRDTTYRITHYQKYDGADKYLDAIVRFCNPDTPQTIYVFAHKTLETYCSDNYEMVTAMIPCSKMASPVPITVYFEKSSKRYFINETTYDVARRKYGLPYLKVKTISTQSGKSLYSQFNPESVLFIYGYNVNAASGPPLSERRALLCEIIDAGILTKYEVINHIEWLIHTRKNMSNQHNALKTWEEDLWFVLNYKSDAQRTIWTQTFKSKFSTVSID